MKVIYIIVLLIFIVFTQNLITKTFNIISVANNGKQNVSKYQLVFYSFQNDNCEIEVQYGTNKYRQQIKKNPSLVLALSKEIPRKYLEQNKLKVIFFQCCKDNDTLNIKLVKGYKYIHIVPNLKQRECSYSIWQNNSLSSLE